MIRRNLKNRHFFHIVNNSPWPFLISICLLSLAFNALFWFHFQQFEYFFYSFTSVFFIMFLWFRDVVREATFEGNHTFEVQSNIRYGMFLFIVSEVMFFFSFFWSFLHCSLAPTYQIGGIWPPLEITTLADSNVPLYNTIFLLVSGATLTWVHYSIVIQSFQIKNFIQNQSIKIIKKPHFSYFSFFINRNDTLADAFFSFKSFFHFGVFKHENFLNSLYRWFDFFPYRLDFFFLMTKIHQFFIKNGFETSLLLVRNALKKPVFDDQIVLGFIYTLNLAFIFIFFQQLEYVESFYSFNDGVYGSLFFLMTGFHGIHVIVGAFFILVCFIRDRFFHFSPKHHIGFQTAAWYWHFVDVVWIFLFCVVYLWGNASYVFFIEG